MHIIYNFWWLCSHTPVGALSLDPVGTSVPQDILVDAYSKLLAICPWWLLVYIKVRAAGLLLITVKIV